MRSDQILDKRRASEIQSRSVMFGAMLMDDGCNDNKLESNLISKRQSELFILNLTAQTQQNVSHMSILHYNTNPPILHPKIVGLF